MKIVVASGKGGVGKSMLASTLVMLFSKDPEAKQIGYGAGKKVVAVDCDADAPNLSIWLGLALRSPKDKRGKILKGEKGGKSSFAKASKDAWDKIISVTTSAKPEFDFKKCNGCGLCAKNCRFEAIKMVKGKPQLNPFLCEGCGACEVVCPQGAIKLKPVQNGEIKIKKTKYGFPLITGQLYPGESGSGKIVDQIKAEADKFSSELMVIDSSPGTGCPVTAALRDANFAILITEPTPSGFTDLKRVLEVVKHFKIPYGTVINKWDINSKLSKKIEKWANKKFLGRISYDKKIFQAIANLTPIMKTKLKAKKEIKKIFKNLKPRIGRGRGNSLVSPA